MNIVQEIVKKHKNFLEKFDDFGSEIDRECEGFFKEMDKFLKTGNADIIKKLSTEKENAEPAIISTSKRKGRAKKPALADITENNILSNTFNIKKEKLSIIQDVPKNSETTLKDMIVEIKKEVEEMPAPTKLPPRKKKVKTDEAVELPKRSTRTRTKAKKQDGNDETSSDKEESRNTKKISDVIIQNTTITTIEISEDSERDTGTESEIEKNKTQNEVRQTRSKMKKKNKPEDIRDYQKNDSEKEQNNEQLERLDTKTLRSTRTKTKQKKRSRSDSVDEPSRQIERKKSRSDSNNEQEYNTEYEDAISMIENGQNADATYIASSKDTQLDIEKGDANIIANSTIVVENPKVLVKDQTQIANNNELRQLETTPSKHANKGKGTKQIFSPFDKTPLKKKVEAFEKLGSETSTIPTRVTRTKKREKEQKKDGNDSEIKTAEEEETAKTTEKDKPKVFTPIASRYMSKVCSTSKISKLHPNYSDISTNNESTLSIKSASALKTSQAEFREREKRRQEKEREALKKREALLQAQTEEKRRKREEKQQKAQQQREMLEKEKLKLLEAQKIKEVKYKQAIAEREEKWQKQKEEAEKKRLMAKKKANELLKEKEEEMRLAEQKKYAEMKVMMDKQGEMAKLALKQKMERAQQQQSLPLYMTTKPPLLPTDDCYDSDDPDFGKVKAYEPSWSRDKEVRDMQVIMIAAGETIKNTFFCRQAQTPDLQAIFEIIDPRKLKRTSSAIWRKPPRYTLMPIINDSMPEFSEDSD